MFLLVKPGLCDQAWCSGSGSASNVTWAESGEEALQGELGSCHPKTGRYAEEKQTWKVTAVPYRRGLAGPKERLDVGGQGANRVVLTRQF